MRAMPSVSERRRETDEGSRLMRTALTFYEYSRATREPCLVSQRGVVRHSQRAVD